MNSKIRRFGGTWAEAGEDIYITKNLFDEIIDNDDVFIWSYESMILYRQAYFRRLYRFLGVRSEFEPPVYDGNLRYIWKNNLA